MTRLRTAYWLCEERDDGERWRDYVRRAAEGATAEGATPAAGDKAAGKAAAIEVLDRKGVTIVRSAKHADIDEYFHVTLPADRPPDSRLTVSRAAPFVSSPHAAPACQPRPSFAPA